MVFKVIAIALIGVMLVSLLRTAKPEFAVFAMIGTGIVIVIYLVSSLSGVVLVFDDLVKKAGLPTEMFALVLKIVGIGYLTEFSASICDDAGCNSIGSKIQLGGKLTIFMMSLSIVSELFKVVTTLLQLGGK